MLRIIFALLLVFFLPGYTLVTTLFPAKSLSIAERLLLCMCLSLAVVQLGGLVLNWMPWGLQAVTWTILLVCITLGASLVALTIRKRQKLIGFRRFKVNLRLHQFFLLGLAFLTVIGAVWIARVGATNQNYTKFTQLWIQPYKSAATNSIQLGVSSFESSEMKFILQLRTGDNVVFDSFSIALKPGESWEKVVPVPPQHPGTKIVEADLYRQDAPDVTYRKVKLWLSK